MGTWVLLLPKAGIFPPREEEWRKRHEMCICVFEYGDLLRAQKSVNGLSTKQSWQGSLPPGPLGWRRAGSPLADSTSLARNTERVHPDETSSSPSEAFAIRGIEFNNQIVYFLQKTHRQLHFFAYTDQPVRPTERAPPSFAFHPAMLELISLELRARCTYTQSQFNAVLKNILVHF